ncbi:HNH endonuclease [Cupriavidus gilardii]|uniref:HNH endonuclease n=1 Tax=Cupriavidus gilardii TaxID=82541 RepID=A0A849B8P9_9BURK|nr:HNH endonuclease [Cupriavidus gilardii]NNH12071.1 HNH endonuclease [Cupriavidus gilardii]WNG69296.1 HNH endonuclease [Cupriavidus gilardii]
MRSLIDRSDKDEVVNQETLINLFDYRDGGLYWRVDRGSNAKAGNRAGRLLQTGYRTIQISGKRYQEHRLVFLLHHGVMPTQIDHINGVKDDNRIENLRPANHSQNQINTAARPGASGERGVRFKPEKNRWIARIYRDGKEIRIGSFKTKEEAVDAYRAAAKEMYGEFAR